MDRRSVPLEQLIDEAYCKLKELGYKPSTLKGHWLVWRILLHWAQKRGFETMSQQLASQFLDEYGLSWGKPANPLDSYQRRLRACVRILEEFALHGCWSRRYSPVDKRRFPEALEPAVTGFLTYCEVQRGIFPSTLHMRKYYLWPFTSFLQTRQVQKWTEVTPEIISAFFAMQIHLQPKTLSTRASTIRHFLKYLWLSELHPQDLSPCLPRIKQQSEKFIPTVWPQEHLEKLLAAVDRGSPLGKRDYAILLLAIRLGLRAGEIRVLTLDHIHWERCELEIFQPKTQNTLWLPLSNELGEALIDYLRYGRPPSTYREVFLRHLAPFEPVASGNTFYRIVTTYRQRAKIPFTRPSRQSGLHSLRHTMASHLLEQGIPLQTIATILGHASQETTRIYTKLNVEALRKAALDVEEVRHD